MGVYLRDKIHIYIFIGQRTVPKAKEKDMSLTRKLLESMSLDSDKVSTIIEAHVETVDSLKAQIDKYKADAEKLTSVEKELATTQTELENIKANGGDWQKKYEKEHTDFEAYKTAQLEKETLATKSEAYKKLLKDNGVSDKVIDKVLKMTDIKALEYENDAFKDADKLTAQIKEEWADFITETDTKGASTKTPPDGNGSGEGIKAIPAIF